MTEGIATVVGVVLGIGLAVAADKYVGTPLERRLRRLLRADYRRSRGQGG